MTESKLHNLFSGLQDMCHPKGLLSQEPPPHVSIYRREAPSGLESYLYDPVLCVVLKGAKAMRSGEIEVQVSAGDALVVSHHLPVVSQIIQAPYVAIVLTLNSMMIRELIAQISEMPVHNNNSAISCHPCTANWLEPLMRYLTLTEEPEAMKMLGPATLREIHYRLLMSPSGHILANIAFKDSHANRIARAVSLIREKVAAPLEVPALAREVGMSGSAFHIHFKAITGTTPLQYQKDLRLITSSILLESGSHTVSSAAFDVGYESSTHFSRDFKRKFGQNPSSFIHKSEL